MSDQPVPPPKDMWIIPVPVTVSDSDKQFIESEVRKGIAKLGPGIDKLNFDFGEITAEWQGVKHVSDEKSAKWSAKEQLAQLAEDTKGAAVILYLHGGSYTVSAPFAHRRLTLPLAKACGGRVFLLNYRLAPQHPFPAAFIDLVLAYKYLIDPPPGALHDPVDPAKIVIAGDSAGVYRFLL
jgi:acetyl esterase/lipase